MEDKVFNLLEKMYVDLTGKIDQINSEMQEMKTDLNGVKQDVGGIKQDLDGVKQDVGGIKQDVNGIRQDIVRLEHKMDENHKALYDGYKQNVESFMELNNKVDRLTEQVEHQEIKLQVIKGSR